MTIKYGTFKDPEKGFGFGIRHKAEFNWTFNRVYSLGTNVSFLKGGLGTYYPGNGASKVLYSMKAKAIGLQLTRFRYKKKGALAPQGVYYRGDILLHLSSAFRHTSDGEFLKVEKGLHGGFSLTVGKKYIVKKWVTLDFGIETGYVIGGHTLRSFSYQYNEAEIPDIEELDKALGARVAAHQFFNIRLGIGFIPF